MRYKPRTTGGGVRIDNKGREEARADWLAKCIKAFEARDVDMLSDYIVQAGIDDWKIRIAMYYKMKAEK